MVIVSDLLRKEEYFCITLCILVCSSVVVLLLPSHIEHQVTVDGSSFNWFSAQQCCEPGPMVGVGSFDI